MARTAAMLAMRDVPDDLSALAKRKNETFHATALTRCRDLFLIIIYVS